MTISTTIDTQCNEFARACDANVADYAGRVPAPLDALVLRIGALNAEAIRQSGRLAISTIDAVTGLAGVARRGATDMAESTEKAFGSSADTIRTTGRRAVGDVKQATSTITNRARSAADSVGRNFRSAGDQVGDAAARVERTGGAVTEQVVKAADTAVAEVGEVAAERPSGPYESWTKEELYDRAQEIDIEGRSNMTKTQLIKALRGA